MGQNGITSVDLQFRHVVEMAGGLLIVIGIFAGLNGFFASTGLGSISASAILGIIGIFFACVARFKPGWLKRENLSYLDRREGAAVAAFVVWLSFLSFAIIIDRTPTSIAASPKAPEGLFVVPGDEFFPLGLELSIVVYTLAASIITVVLGLALSHLLENIPTIQHIYLSRPLKDWYHVSSTISILIFVFVLVNLLVLMDLSIPGGIEIEGRTPSSIPLTGKLILWIIGALLVLPVPVYTLPLLPGWLEESESGKHTEREYLQDYIDANWRRARILTTFALTGAVGIALSFVFSRASPFITFVVAVVGSIILGPLGIVWFLMRRVREAEKELQPT